MDTPTMFAPRKVAADTTALTAYLPIPEAGILPVNAFVIGGREPVLVDTGLAALRQPFLETLRSVIDPAAIRWIWISHTDADHVGNLEAVLAEAPHAQVVTNFLGRGKMMLQGLPVDRVHLLEPNARLETPDRTLVPMRPPYYDAPETTGFYDTASKALFSADAFGGLMRDPAEEAAAIPAEELREGMAAWSSIDAPWLQLAEPARLDAVFREIEGLEPSVVLSGHLPAASGMTATLVKNVRDGIRGAEGGRAAAA